MINGGRVTLELLCLQNSKPHHLKIVSAVPADIFHQILRGYVDYKPRIIEFVKVPIEVYFKCRCFFSTSLKMKHKFQPILAIGFIKSFAKFTNINFRHFWKWSYFSNIRQFFKPLLSKTNLIVQKRQQDHEELQFPYIFVAYMKQSENWITKITIKGRNGAQYLCTWRQSVVPNDAPRDFGPQVAFGAKFQIPVAMQ